jgi:hypothetical protein
VSEEDGFLNRWSARKRGLDPEPEPEPDPLAAQPEAADDEDLTDAELLEKLELPDPSTLGEGDDFKPFLGQAIPQRIRRLALRRLWRVNPMLANLDELLDYGEDFTDAAMVVEGMQTTYEVGKGLRAHVEELARQAEKEAEGSVTEADISEATTAEDEVTTEDAAPTEPEVEPEALPELEVVDAEPTPQAEAEPREPVTAAVEDRRPLQPPDRPRQRMRFTFDGDGSA